MLSYVKENWVDILKVSAVVAIMLFLLAAIFMNAKYRIDHNCMYHIQSFNGPVYEAFTYIADDDFPGVVSFHDANGTYYPHIQVSTITSVCDE